MFVINRRRHFRLWVTSGPVSCSIISSSWCWETPVSSVYPSLLIQIMFQQVVWFPYYYKMLPVAHRITCTFAFTVNSLVMLYIIYRYPVFEYESCHCHFWCPVRFSPSVQRSVYKDLVLLLQKEKYLTLSQLKSKARTNICPGLLKRQRKSRQKTKELLCLFG